MSAGKRIHQFLEIYKSTTSYWSLVVLNIGPYLHGNREGEGEGERERYYHSRQGAKPDLEWSTAVLPGLAICRSVSRFSCACLRSKGNTHTHTHTHTHRVTNSSHNLPTLSWR